MSMNKTNPREGITTRAIVLGKRKGSQYSTFSFMTERLGVIRCTVQNKRLQSMKHNAYLRPYSAIYMTVVPESEFYRLTQIDGVYVIESLDESLYNIGYAALASEIILQLFPSGDVDPTVFREVAWYSKWIQTRNMRQATIILGWKLYQLSGIVPPADAFASGNGIDLFCKELEQAMGQPVSHDLIQLLPHVLAFNWKHGIPLQNAQWDLLERWLIGYGESHLDMLFKSLGFIHGVV